MPSEKVEGVRVSEWRQQRRLQATLSRQGKGQGQGQGRRQRQLIILLHLTVCYNSADVLKKTPRALARATTISCSGIAQGDENYTRWRLRRRLPLQLPLRHEQSKSKSKSRARPELAELRLEGRTHSELCKIDYNDCIWRQRNKETKEDGGEGRQDAAVCL